MHYLIFQSSKAKRRFWLSLSLAFTFVYAFLALKKALSGEYVIQDDARQHVFWMRRFLDSQLFPHDLIADYFQSVAPWGYSSLYRIMAWLGIDPVFLSKLLPLPLALLTTTYCFWFCLELLPLPITGFIAALLLNQNLWIQDGLVSATPRAFIYPIFLAFLYYLVRRSFFGVILSIVLLGLFYPSLVFICAVLLILQVIDLQNLKPRFSQQKRDYILSISGLIISFLILLPYALNSSQFSPVITVAEARKLPEFFPGGRSKFFLDRHPWDFWFNGSRSGMRIPTALMPELVYCGLILPFIMLKKDLFLLANKISDKVAILPQLILASLLMFFTAHAWLFKLHLPSRYTQHSFRIVLVVAASITFTILLDAVFEWANKSTYTYTLSFRQLVAYVCSITLAWSLLIYPTTWKSFPWTGYVRGQYPEIYNFLQQQPQDITIASLVDEVNNIPAFAQRSILVGSEYAIPYHFGYYRLFRQRTLELITAQYTSNALVLSNFITKYGIDFWLIDNSVFNHNYLANNSWLKQYQPATDEAIKKLQGEQQPILKKLGTNCQVLQEQNLTVIDGKCLKTKLHTGTFNGGKSTPNPDNP